MKKIYLLLAAWLVAGFAAAQVIRFDLNQKVTVLSYSGDSLSYPFAGGLNSPQFNQTDIDGDGVKDLFVFDRSGNKALTFIRKNGRFVYAPEYEVQFPKLFNWVVFKDFNKDGKDDIFSEVDYNAQPEPDKYVVSNGIRLIRNISTQPGKLIWKQDKNQLMDIGLDPLPPSNMGISNADYSAIEDLDGDGDLDMLQMPFGKNVITFYQNMSKEHGHNLDSMEFLFRDECWGYSSYLVNTNGFLLHDNSPCYRNYKSAKHNGTTLTAFDKDNDGDMDLLYGDVGFSDLVYLENGRTLNSLGRDSMISQDTVFPFNSRRASLLTFPASYLVDVDYDGKRDLLVAPNTDAGSKNKENVLYYKNTGSGSNYTFTYQSGSFLIDQMVDLGGGSIPEFVDLDADGDLDIVVASQGDFSVTSNSNDKLFYFENKGDSLHPLFKLTDTTFLGINTSGSPILYMKPTFGDLNGDGKPDLLIGDLNGKFHYFANTSNLPAISFTKISSDYFNMYAGTSAAPQLVDLNKDGRLDIVTGRKNGTLAYFENTGTTLAPAFPATPTIDSIGKFTVAEFVMSGGVPFYYDGYSVPHVCDLDKDGNYEVLVGSISGKVQLFRNFEASATRTCNEIQGIFSDAPANTPADLTFGSKTSAFTADLDKDGKPELLIGNSRGGLRLYSGTINGVISGVETHSASEAPSLSLYPNPAREKVLVLSDKNLKNVSYSVVNVTGAVVLTGSFDSYRTEIQVSGLARGFYILTARSEDGEVYSGRFMVE